MTKTATQNGRSADPLTDAIATEATLADEAAQIRGDQAGMTHELFAKLYDLLTRPIPAGFIETIGQVTGKPYDSTGIKSVQVQVDRMNNVLGPTAWTDDAVYHQDGKLCEVTIRVITLTGDTIAKRSSWGGVDRGSGLGNLYKGSYTNAAKLAFARLGVGHEVYVGATDHDPDTNPDAAKAQAGAPSVETTLSTDQSERVRKTLTDAGIRGDELALMLAACGVETVEALTAAKALKLREEIDKKLARSAA